MLVTNAFCECHCCCVNPERSSFLTIQSRRSARVTILGMTSRTLQNATLITRSRSARPFGLGAIASSRRLIHYLTVLLVGMSKTLSSLLVASCHILFHSPNVSFLSSRLEDDYWRDCCDSQNDLERHPDHERVIGSSFCQPHDDPHFQFVCLEIWIYFSVLLMSEG